MLSDYRTTETISGDLRYTSIIVKKVINRCSRAARSNITREAQARFNERKARLKLTQTIEANFVSNDVFVTLTYENEVSEQEAAIQLRNYLDRLRRVYRKEGEELRYTYVTEYGKDGRIHHHIVIGASESVKLKKLREKWKAGFCLTKRIYEKENGFEELANYMTKNPVGKRRYKCSLNLKKPVEVINDEKYSPADVARFVQAINDGTGREYAEKLYPGYRCIRAEVEYNEPFSYMPGIYIKMRKNASERKSREYINPNGVLRAWPPPSAAFGLNG